MEQLERLLSDISEAERQEALEYYEGYFDDAGPENEGEVIRELGNPGKVAAIIKADLQENGSDYGEYTENGYQDTRVSEEGDMPDKYTEITVQGKISGNSDSGNNNSGYNRGRRENRAERGYHAEKKQNKPGDHPGTDRSCFCGTSYQRGVWRGSWCDRDTGIASVSSDIFCRRRISGTCDRGCYVCHHWNSAYSIHAAGRNPYHWCGLPDDGTGTSVSGTDCMVWR